MWHQDFLALKCTFPASERIPCIVTTLSYRITSPRYICYCYACEVCLLKEYAIRHTLEKQLSKFPFLPSFRKYHPTAIGDLSLADE